MAPRNDQAKTAAGQLLAQMKASGIEHVLANAGTDFPSLIEAFSDSTIREQLPRPMAIHHESVAMGMAHGYHLVSGRMAAVIVHVNVGLANCAMGAINAASSHVPVLLLSGRTPATETGRLGSRVAPIHWGQEMYDQASLVREAVKWEYELRFPEQAATAVARAVAIAATAPAGPVYLSLPREVLAETIDNALPPPVIAPVRPAPPNRDALHEAAELLATAKSPVIVVQRSAPDGNIPGLLNLCEEFAIPVVEFWATANAVPTTHPMYAGFDPGPMVKEADVVLTIGASVPWTPAGAVGDKARVIALGPDPLDTGTPYRGFRIDVAVAADLALGVAALAEALAPRKRDMNIADREGAQARRRAAAEEAIGQMVAEGEAGPMNHAYVSRVLSEEAGDDAAIFSELGATGSAVLLNRPGQLYWTPLSGGLGWGVPAALGAKLADPARTAIATVGDGSYMFANPTACHQVAVTHDLPILTVVFNNGRWQAVKRATLGMYPDGLAAKSNEMPLTALGPPPDYCLIAKAHGAHTERVEKPADLREAIRRALREVRDGRQALLDVVVA